jgi:hypothetical protein
MKQNVNFALGNAASAENLGKWDFANLEPALLFLTRFSISERNPS